MNGRISSGVACLRELASTSREPEKKDSIHPPSQTLDPTHPFPSHQSALRGRLREKGTERGDGRAPCCGWCRV